MIVFFLKILQNIFYTQNTLYFLNFWKNQLLGHAQYFHGQFWLFFCAISICMTFLSFLFIDLDINFGDIIIYLFFSEIRPRLFYLGHALNSRATTKIFFWVFLPIFIIYDVCFPYASKLTKCSHSAFGIFNYPIMRKFSI